MLAYSINPERGYAIITISGQPQLHEYIDTARALGNDEQFFPSTHRICDFSLTKLDVTGEELAAFAEEARSLPKEDTTRTAFIANTEEEREILSTFSKFFNKGQFGVFELGTEAIQWILQTQNHEVPKQPEQVRVHRLRGDVTEEDVLNMQSAWFDDEGFDQTTPLLWDLREAQLRIELEDLESIANKMHEYAVTHRPDGKSAALISSKLHEGVLKTGFRQGIQEGRLRFFWAEKDAYDYLTG